MKSFEDFLLKNPLQKSALSKMFIEEFERCRSGDFDENSRLIAAAMLATARMFDARLKSYHNWLHQPDKNKWI